MLHKSGIDYSQYQREQLEENIEKLRASLEEQHQQLLTQVEDPEVSLGAFSAESYHYAQALNHLKSMMNRLNGLKA